MQVNTLECSGIGKIQPRFCNRNREFCSFCYHFIVNLCEISLILQLKNLSSITSITPSITLLSLPNNLITKTLT